jgi:hypothetical protein
MSAAEGSPKSPSRGDKIAPREGHTHAYFTFGRFQPPTLGHRVLAETLNARRGADSYIFVSSSQDPVKNPLDVHTKVSWMKYMFRDLTNVRVINTTVCECRSVPQVVNKLKEAGYTKITMIVGSDREGAFGFLKDVEFEEAGAARNNAAAGATGMSGTKMRAAAVANNVAAFKTGTGLSTPMAHRLMGQIKEGLIKPATKAKTMGKRGGGYATKSQKRRRITRRRSKLKKITQFRK